MSFQHKQSSQAISDGTPPTGEPSHCQRPHRGGSHADRCAAFSGYLIATLGAVCVLVSNTLVGGHSTTCCCWLLDCVAFARTDTNACRALRASVCPPRGGPRHHAAPLVDWM